MFKDFFVDTVSIEEILKKKNEELGNVYDLNTLRGIVEVSKRCFFYSGISIDDEPMLKDEMYYIDEAWRNFFMTVFPLHYFKDEIGYEDIDDFKRALMAKIVENSYFINIIFENMEKQGLASFRTKRVDQTGQHTDLSNILSMDVKNHSNSQNESVSGNTNNVHQGSNATVNNTQESESASNTQDKNNIRSASEQKNYADNESRATADTSRTDHNTSDGQTYNNEQTETTTTGAYIDMQTGSESHVIDDTTTADRNASMVLSDTPQGSLQNIRSGTVSKGAGITAGVGGTQQFNYMSSAQLNDATDKSVTRRTDKTTYGQDTNSYGQLIPRVSSRLYGSSYDYYTFDETTGDAIEHKDDKPYKVTENKTGGNTVSHTGYDTTSTNGGESKGKQSNENSQSGESNSEQMTGTNERESGTIDNSSHTEQSNDSNTSASDRISSDTGTENGQSNATNAKSASDIGNTVETEDVANLELLAAAEPFMNKIWKIFDDVFLTVIDVWP